LNRARPGVADVQEADRSDSVKTDSHRGLVSDSQQFDRPPSRDRLTAADRVDAFVGLRFDAHDGVDIEAAGDRLRIASIWDRSWDSRDHATSTSDP
jgi:hypothetical protein